MSVSNDVTFWEFVRNHAVEEKEEEGKGGRGSWEGKG